jgi:hypothetical protein
MVSICYSGTDLMCAYILLYYTMSVICVDFPESYNACKLNF